MHQAAKVLNIFHFKPRIIHLLRAVLPFQFSSVAQSYPTLCDPMNHSTPGLPVHHQHPEFTQTHVHRVGDAIQPSHLLSSPSPPAHNPPSMNDIYTIQNMGICFSKTRYFIATIFSMQRVNNSLSPLNSSYQLLQS